MTRKAASPATRHSPPPPPRRRGGAVLAAALLFILLALPVPAAGKVLDVEVIESPGEIEAWLVRDETVPVVSISFSFDGGLAYDPPGKPGTGRLVSILLDEGAGDMDSQQFQQKLTDNAISMRFSAGRDAFYGRVKTLKENSGLAFDLLGLALSRPRFDKDAVARMKNANISQIRDNMGDPSWLAARTFNGMVFEDHPYETPGHGHLASMQAITRDDLSAYAKNQFAKNVLKVAIAGDLTREEAGAALDRIFGALPEKAAPVHVADAALAHAGKTILLPLATPQTYIAAGSAGIRRTDPAWHAAVVLNHILGGGSFESRLMQEIREKRGLTYGVYSTLTSMKHAALVQASLSASNEKAAEALALLRREWRKMAKHGPTEAEIADAKSYITGSLLLHLTSTDDIADTLNGLQQDGLDAEYINRRNDAIRAVTAQDVRKAAARLLREDTLTVILVGQPKDINADIMLDKPPGMQGPKGQK